ncbi:hypothetical protein J6590_047545 [Homalodisca vitripennis]|nr:hypothetical protein J6590_047545 [Homalodisca vitripennis]
MKQRLAPEPELMPCTLHRSIGQIYIETWPSRCIFCSSLQMYRSMTHIVLQLQLQSTGGGDVYMLAYCVTLAPDCLSPSRGRADMQGHPLSSDMHLPRLALEALQLQSHRFTGALCYAQEEGDVYMLAYCVTLAPDCLSLSPGRADMQGHPLSSDMHLPRLALEACWARGEGDVYMLAYCVTLAPDCLSLSPGRADMQGHPLSSDMQGHPLSRTCTCHVSLSRPCEHPSQLHMTSLLRHERGLQQRTKREVGCGVKKWERKVNGRSTCVVPAIYLAPLRPYDNYYPPAVPVRNST